MYITGGRKDGSKQPHTVHSSAILRSITITRALRGRIMTASSVYDTVLLIQIAPSDISTNLKWPRKDILTFCFFCFLGYCTICSQSKPYFATIRTPASSIVGEYTAGPRPPIMWDYMSSDQIMIPTFCRISNRLASQTSEMST